ncbi:hypothetical protein D3C74_49680 [compost metagenome]
MSERGVQLSYIVSPSIVKELEKMLGTRSYADVKNRIVEAIWNDEAISLDFPGGMTKGGIEQITRVVGFKLSQGWRTFYLPSNPPDVDNTELFAYFADRTRSLLARWENFVQGHPETDQREAIKGFLAEVNDNHTKELLENLCYGDTIVYVSVFHENARSNGIDKILNSELEWIVSTGETEELGEYTILCSNDLNGFQEYGDSEEIKQRILDIYVNQDKERIFRLSDGLQVCVLGRNKGE